MAPALIPIAMQLAQFAPSIIKLLTGSDKAEQVAGAVIGVAKAVTGMEDGASAVAAIQADPAKVMEFQRAMAERQDEMERAYLADVQNARGRDVELAKAGILNHRANVLAGAALLMVILCLLVVVWSSNMDEYAKATISLILGRALGWVEQLFSFEFGSTRSSKTKDDTISKLSSL